MTVALVGSESLIGREIRDVLSGNSLGQSLKLIAAEGEEAGKLTEQSGEPAILGELDQESLESAQIIFLAGPPQSTRKVRSLKPRGALIDLTGAAEGVADARLRAPMAEPDGYRPPAGAVHVVAASAAIAIAVVLGRLHAKHKIKRSVAHVFEPASERGQGGIEELQQQTIGLLSFKNQPKATFDAQLAFNLLPRYGEEAPAALDDSALRIERHLATLLSHQNPHPPMPSLRLLQAPVFHGYSISVWVEFETNPGISAIEAALDSEPIDVHSSDTEPPTAVGMAGQDGIAVGNLTIDRNNTQAAWLWIVTDNLRLQARNAIALAQDLL